MGAAAEYRGYPLEDVHRLAEASTPPEVRAMVAALEATASSAAAGAGALAVVDLADGRRVALARWGAAIDVGEALWALRP